MPDQPAPFESRPRLTPYQLDRLEQMLLDGETVANIVRVVECSPNTVTRYRKHLGLPCNNPQVTEDQAIAMTAMLKAKMKPAQITAVLGVSLETVKRHRHRLQLRDPEALKRVVKNTREGSKA